ncbi:MAG: SDR family NAD(P)-dependent oxidoreductase, partial [Chloroflexi bacterium]|nr:SDR family NAD(P)-dependent oxidoreductase [Chloroflexota bacterium]
MAKRLQGKVALVTGSGQGLGKGIAITLARNGADVVVFDMNQETATQVAHAIENLGQRALAVQGSVGNREDVDRIYNAALAEFAHVDIVVNNAG